MLVNLSPRSTSIICTNSLVKKKLFISTMVSIVGDNGSVFFGVVIDFKQLLEMYNYLYYVKGSKAASKNLYLVGCIVFGK